MKETEEIPQLTFKPMSDLDELMSAVKLDGIPLLNSSLSQNVASTSVLAQ